MTWRGMAVGAVLSVAVSVGAADPDPVLGHGRRRAVVPSRGHPTLSVAEARALVDHYAALYRIPLTIARNLVTVESAWRQHAVSYAGAIGFTQLMPATARDLGVNPYDPRQNIEGGLRYLAQQFRRFKRWDLALAAYNTGPGRVTRYGGAPPWTRRYIRLITGRPLPGSLGPAVARRSPADLVEAAAWVAARINLRALIEAMVELPAGVRRSKLL